MAITRIVWSTHAEDRLRDRPEIGRAEVEAAILHPDQVFLEPAHPSRLVAHKRQSVQGVSFLLRVFYIVEPNGDAATVVSFYRTSQVRRNWKG